MSNQLSCWCRYGVGSKGSAWRRFRLEEGIFKTPLENDERWITIEK